MEAKAAGRILVPISWVYKGEEDTGDLKGVTHVVGYKGKIGLSQAPGKNIPLYFFFDFNK